MALQQEISWQKHQTLVGRDAWVLIDEAASETEPAVGRLSSQAPDIDGVVYVDGSVESGELVRVEITSADAYDLTARVIASDALSDPDLLHQRDNQNRTG
jgi:ribosomal protein S12 methylthiotransferase